MRFCLSVCLCTMSSEEGLDPLGLELQAVVNDQVGTGTQTLVLCKSRCSNTAVRVLCGWAVCLSSPYWLYLFTVYGCLSAYVSLYHVFARYSQMPEEGVGIPWDWSYRCLWAVMLALIIEPRFSSALNLMRYFLSPIDVILKPKYERRVCVLNTPSLS